MPEYLGTQEKGQDVDDIIVSTPAPPTLQLEVPHHCQLLLEHTEIHNLPTRELSRFEPDSRLVDKYCSFGPLT